MSSHEHPSPRDTTTPEHRRDYNARQLLAQNALLLGAFYFDFHKPYYESPRANRNSSVLALGEVGTSIVIARHDESISPLEPDAYFIRQYDLASQATIQWNVSQKPAFHGGGDILRQTLLLHKPGEMKSTAALLLSSEGNAWQQPDKDSGYLSSSHLLPYQAMHDLRLTVDELHEKLLGEQQ